MGPPAADCTGRAAPATSARLKRPCARVLPASVRQGTQPCFSRRPHIGGGRCYRTGATLTSLAGTVAKGQWRSESAMRRGPEYCPLWSESKGTVRRLVLADYGSPQSTQIARSDRLKPATQRTGKRRRAGGRPPRQAGNRPRGAYLPPMLASICFWIFSRLNEPGVALGG